MSEKLRPVIKEKRIINLKQILTEIKTIDEQDLLSEYQKEVKDYSINNEVEGLTNLYNALSNRLDELNPNIVKEEITIKDANNLISSLFNNMTISKDKLNKLQKFIKDGINQIHPNKIDYELQNTIDMYIVYLEKKENLETLSTNEMKIINNYRQVISEREKLLDISYIADKPSTKKLNTNGAVITVVLLEVTILLGILISAIALVKR